ncbi:MAG: hypothetical protein FRX48_01223 [Lasallia pustulata]|uniref:Uncharacterized protein n=1 Tax=Lasallia pustulata TaxID=136370 RepID=A0A5M8Q0H8_9LECA|nr:MAG: hypothetical protein FRX48_01223 [Lasallia pustulata]
MQQVIPVKTTNQSLSSGITPLARHKRWIVKDADIKKSTKNVNTSSFEDEDVMHLAENDLNYQKDKYKVQNGLLFDFLFGDPETAAIYYVCKNQDKPQIFDNFTTKEIKVTLLEGQIEVRDILSHVVDNFYKSFDFIRSLKAFSSASSVYEKVEGASITMKILTGSLYQARGIPVSVDK